MAHPGGVNNVCDRSKKIVGGRAKVRRLVPPSSQLPGSAPPSSNNAMALGGPHLSQVDSKPNALVRPFIVVSWLNDQQRTSTAPHQVAMRRSRPWVHKIGVLALILADGACVIAVSFNVCNNVTGAFRNPHYFVAPIAAQIMTTYVSAVIAQLFFCNIFYTLTRNVVVSGVMLLLITVHLGFSWASAILLIQNPTATSGISLATTTSGAVSCAATDVIIAGCLATKFGMLMREIVPGRTARSLVQRILILAVASGAIYFTILFVLQGRIYALSILGNFLLGIPGGIHDETTPSQRFGSMLSHSVVFSVPDPMAPRRSRAKSSDVGGSRARSMVDGTMTHDAPSLSYTGDANGCESVHLHELRFTSPRDKGDFEEA
ncbi:hypothetical protein B0H14DRAFT_2589066 [Mycena olivaceomarginata]|nr:hypothetical protein B0H14DRAFT_2589066 [Mycena olivaceomarginata]